VSIERIHSLYRVSLLGMDNVEPRARRGKSWRNIPVALCMTEVRCLVNRSLESRRRPRYRACVFHGITACWKLNGAGGIGFLEEDQNRRKSEAMTPDGQSGNGCETEWRTCVVC
jgi:hypothetical protein